jgi:hypothetical protein
MPTDTLIPTPTLTPTMTPTPTPIPQSSIISLFESNGWDPCWKMGFGIDDGVYSDGVAYKCLYKPNYIDMVLVGYDGTIRMVGGGYKASFGSIDNNIVGKIYGDDVRSWVIDNFSKIEGGRQESTIGNFHVTLYLAVEKDAIPGGWGTGLDYIVEIVPFGAESHLSK